VSARLAAIVLAATTSSAAIVGGGCATIVASGPDSIPVSTNPPGAYVYVNGQVVGQTPMVVELDRGRSMADIRIYYPGFQPVQLARYKSLNGWVFGNFCLGIWPLVIDLATGNWQRFEDEPIAIGLTPGHAPPPYGVEPMAPPPAPVQPPAGPPTQPQPPPFPSTPPPAAR
jgi:hypothetical protein